MRILNFGSLNVDYVYGVDHFVRPGETLPGRTLARFAGGKGCNQSIALARAGAPVAHAGKLNSADRWICGLLEESGADVALTEFVSEPSGHAIIQVDSNGQNAIIIHGGANQLITPADAERVLAGFGAGDLLLVQNEISSVREIMLYAHQQRLRIAFNPAPMTAAVPALPLELLSYLILNETEGQALTGNVDAVEILDQLAQHLPETAVVLTLGAAGALYRQGAEQHSAPGVKVSAVDTTAAGDTFIGYFLAAVTAGETVTAALRTACQAAAICVTRPGAAASIPRREEVAAALHS